MPERTTAEQMRYAVGELAIGLGIIWDRIDDDAKESYVESVCTLAIAAGVPSEVLRARFDTPMAQAVVNRMLLEQELNDE